MRYLYQKERSFESLDKLRNVSILNVRYKFIAIGVVLKDNFVIV